MSYLPHILNTLLMILMPLVLARLINAKRQPGWGFFGLGAVTFILAQVAHIPFNWLVLRRLSLLPTDTSQLVDLAVLATFLGLSAGIFEEGARYFTLRFWAVEARSWGRGLMLGAGHGGAEAIILGLVLGVNYLILSRMRQGALLNLVPAGQLPMVQAQISAVFSAPWHLILLGALERLFALCFHLSASLLVMQVFIRGQIAWLFLAILWHSLLNATAVFAAATWTPYVTEAIIGLLALISVAITFWLRRPEPATPELVSLPLPEPLSPLEWEPTERAIDESRYMS